VKLAARVTFWLGAALWLAPAVLVVVLWLHRRTSDTMYVGRRLAAWANEVNFSVSHTTWTAGEPLPPDWEQQWAGASVGSTSFDLGTVVLRSITLQVPHWMAFAALAIPPASWGGWWFRRRLRRHGRGFEVQPRAMEQQP
jgi:hypothetical protein